MTVIEMMNFDNSPAEYAMLNGWNNDMGQWSRAQKNAYLKWSTSSEVAPSTNYSDATEYMIEGGDAFSRTGLKPGIAGKEGIEMQMLTRAAGADTVSTVSSWNTELDYSGPRQYEMRYQPFYDSSPGLPGNAASTYNSGTSSASTISTTQTGESFQHDAWFRPGGTDPSYVGSTADLQKFGSRPGSVEMQSLGTYTEPSFQQSEIRNLGTLTESTDFLPSLDTEYMLGTSPQLPDNKPI